MRVRSVVIASALVWVACSGLLPRPDPARCGVVPVSSADLPADLRLRVRARFAAGDRAIGLELIAQESMGELVVVGAAPHGARLFSVRQRGTAFAVDASISRELRYVAYWVMDALHRVYWIHAPEHLPDGHVRRWERAGEVVEESWRGSGRRRTFGRARSDGEPGYPEDGFGDPDDKLVDPDDKLGVPDDELGVPDDDPKRVTIDYLEDGASVEIRNPWCGYEAVFVDLGSRAVSDSRLER